MIAQEEIITQKGFKPLVLEKYPPITLLSEMPPQSSPKLEQGACAISPGPESKQGYFAPIPKEGEGFQEVLKKLLALLKLEQNWDFKAGVPLTHEAFFAVLPVLRVALNFQPFQPEIIPLRRGGLLLEWQKQDRVFHIEISAIGDIEYSFAAGENVIDEGRDFPNLKDVFSWFIEGTHLC